MIVTIVQARMGSTRLPGKVFKEIAGKPMLWHVFDRLSRCDTVCKRVLATTTAKKDDVLQEFAERQNVHFFRGSEEDVLSRYYEAAKEFNAQHVVRLTSDCPLIDPKIVDTVISEHLESKADYTSNCTIKRTFPRGLDTEVFTFNALERAFKEAKEPPQREHVTPYIWENSEKFKLHSVEALPALRRPDLRLTVDTKEDLELVREIYSRLYKPGEIFSAGEVVSLLDEHPELVEINSDVRQKETRE